MERLKVIKYSTIALVLLSIVLALFYYAVPYISTKNAVEKAAAIARAKDLPDKYCFENLRDWWGNEVCVQRDAIDNGKAIAYTAASAYRDGVFATDDDLHVTLVDLNKSKIIGEWVGKRSVRAFEGFKEGVISPDKFKDHAEASQREEKSKKSWKFWQQ